MNIHTVQFVSLSDVFRALMMGEREIDIFLDYIRASWGDADHTLISRPELRGYWLGYIDRAEFTALQSKQLRELFESTIPENVYIDLEN